MKTMRKINKNQRRALRRMRQLRDICAEGALRIINGKAKVISEVFCDGLAPAWVNARRTRLR